jgi:hypothetical protein
MKILKRKFDVPTNVIVKCAMRQVITIYVTGSGQDI